jgi:hypothetical protein
MNVYEAMRARANAELAGAQQTAALALVGAALLVTWWGPYPDPDLRWLDGDGSSGARGPALRCDTLAAAFIATQQIRTQKGPLCRWVRDVTGYLVVPVELLPRASA